MSNRRAGLLEVIVNGDVQECKGNFTYNLGLPKRTAIVGQTRVHGYKEETQVPYVEGEITDNRNLDLKALVTLDDATVVLRVANGKTVVYKKAWYAADGNVQSDEANVQLRFESSEPGEEIA